MKSSSTSSWQSSTRQSLSHRRRTAQEALITSSTRELVELYWTNRKRFSGAYKGFPYELI